MTGIGWRRRLLRGKAHALQVEKGDNYDSTKQQ